MEMKYISGAELASLIEKSLDHRDERDQSYQQVGLRTQLLNFPDQISVKITVDRKNCNQIKPLQT